MKRITLLLLTVLSLGLLAACSSMFGSTADDPALNAGKSLVAMNDTISTIHEGFRAPCANRIVPINTCDEVHRLTMEAGPIYDAAAAAEILTLQSGDLQDQEQYERWRSELVDLSAKLTALAVQYSVNQGE